MRKLLLATSLLVLTGCFAGPTYEGEATFNFDGNVFQNREPMETGPLDMVKLSWGMVTQAERWPGWIEDPLGEVVPEPNEPNIQVTYINHATTLVNINGLNVLTDPIYSERASPVSWAGPKRVRKPGIELEDLPHIDVIVISHNHYDHLDVFTLKQIAAQQKEQPLVLAGLGNGLLFKQIGLTNYQDLQWDQTLSHKGVNFTFVECRHRSGRGISDQMKTLWGSFVIKAPQGSVYFAGDTAYSPHLKKHGEQYGPFDLSILPIGAYEPRWFMHRVHMNPAEAVQAHLDLRSEQSLSIHFGVFQLTYEGIDTPEQELEIALESQNVEASEFWTLLPGQSRIID